MPTTLPFCGANRLRDLEMLQNRWTLASDVSDPSPQIVVIKAEPGIGKTRLALEFYKWLRHNVERTSPGYWRADLTHIDDKEVNPDPRLCDFNTEIPFLWWGIRPVQRDNKVAQGDAVAEADHFLAPHLAALSIRSAIAQGAKDFATACLKCGITLTPFELINQFATAGMALLDTAGAIVGATNASSQKKAMGWPVSRAMSIVDKLDSVLSPKKLTYAKTPGVILIDDAQFSHTDAALPSFIETLLHKAVTRKWPVMIIATHWRAQFSSELAPAKTSLVGILNHARHSNAKSFGPAASLPGGFLKDENYLELDIKKADDLSPALQSRLPGLTPQQVASLLSRTDGNPRYLEQLIRYAEVNESLFVGKSPKKLLTPIGLAKLLEAGKATEIFNVVKLRMRGAPQQVQEAVCLASLQGMRFTSDLVEALAKGSLGCSRKEYIEVAETPYSFVTRSRRSPDQEVGQFAEGIFLQVADDLRPNVETLPDDEQLKHSFREALANMLSDPKFEIATSAEARLLIFSIAADVFESSTVVEERQIALRSLGALVRLEMSRGALEAAAAAYERIAGIEPTADMSLVDEVRTHEALAFLYWLLKWPSKCSGALKTMIRLSLTLIGDNGRILAFANDPDTVRKYYSAWRIARIQMWKDEGADADQRRMEEVATQLYLGSIRTLCKGLLRMSELARIWPDLEARNGDAPVGEAPFMIQTIVAPNVEKLLADRGISLGDPETESDIAAHQHEKWAYMLGTLLDDKVVQRDHLEMLDELSNRATREGDPDGSAEYLKRALTIAREIGDPVEQIQILSNLGAVLGHIGDREAAYNSLGEAGNILDHVFFRDTIEVTAPRQNPKVFEELGMEGGRDKVRFPRVLRPLLEEDEIAAIRLFLRLLRLAGNVVGNLARTNREDGNLDDARFGYERAFHFHYDGNDPSGAATDLFNLGSLLRDEEQIDGARENFEKALSIYRKLHDYDKNEFGLSQWFADVERIQAVIDDLPDKALL